MTDEEKQAFKKLKPEEVERLIDELRAQAATAADTERKKAYDLFFNGAAQGAGEKEVNEQNEYDIFDLDKNQAFQKIKKRIKNR